MAANTPPAQVRPPQHAPEPAPELLPDRAPSGRCDLPVVVPGRGSGSLEELLVERFPRMLMIQTTSFCNASCVFCPLPGLRRAKPQGRMDQALFARILDEVSRHGEEVTCINLFLMNEPLTDPRLVERVHAAKAACPRAQISLWTNAVALRPELTDQLMQAPLDSLGVSLHAHRPETWARITGRRDFYKVLRRLVYFVEQRLARRPDMSLVLRYVGTDAFMSKDELDEARAFWENGEVTLDIDPGFLSRAGNQPAPAEVRSPHRWLAGCQALGGPKQLHVLYTGQVVLCCMDYRRVTDLGDLTRESIEQVWTGPRRREVLEALYGAREAPEGFLCSRCELALPRRTDPSGSPSARTTGTTSSVFRVRRVDS